MHPARRLATGSRPASGPALRGCCDRPDSPARRSRRDRPASNKPRKARMKPAEEPVVTITRSGAIVDAIGLAVMPRDALAQRRDAERFGIADPAGFERRPAASRAARGRRRAGLADLHVDDRIPSPFFRRRRRQYVHGQERRDFARAFAQPAMRTCGSVSGWGGSAACGSLPARKARLKRGRRVRGGRSSRPWRRRPRRSSR